MTQTLTLLVGALAAETQPVLAAMVHRTKIYRGLYVGYLRGSRVAILTSGIGPSKAEYATREAMNSLSTTGYSVERIVSFGTCGSLVDELKIGDLICAESLSLDGGLDRPTEIVGGLRPVNVVTVDKAVTTNLQRELLAERGFHVCEMEAAGVIKASNGIPFSVVKVISDAAGGDPEDKVIAKGPRPVRIARFMIRARLLSAAHLVPALGKLVVRAL